MKKYQIQNSIGTGNFSTVFKGIWTADQSPCAIKILKSHHNIALREAQLLKKFNHPNIISIIDFEQTTFESRLILEFLGINTLDLYQAQPHGLKQEQVKCILFQAALGLACVHAQHIIHRDIKPENILIDKKAAIVKIIDFGLAVNESVVSTDYIATRWYRAPENLLETKEYSCAIDVFSLGCVIVQLYLGSPLFPGTNNLDQIHKIFEVLGPPTLSNWPKGFTKFNDLGIKISHQTHKISLSQILQLCDQKFIDLISRMLKINPKDRITMAQVLKHEYFKDIKSIVPPFVWKRYEQDFLTARNLNFKGFQPVKCSKQSEQTNNHLKINFHNVSSKTTNNQMIAQFQVKPSNNEQYYRQQKSSSVGSRNVPIFSNGSPMNKIPFNNNFKMNKIGLSAEAHAQNQFQTVCSSRIEQQNTNRKLSTPSLTKGMPYQFIQNTNNSMTMDQRCEKQNMMRRDNSKNFIFNISQSASPKNMLADEKLLDQHEITISTKIPESAESANSNFGSSTNRVAQPFTRSQRFTVPTNYTKATFQNFNSASQQSFNTSFAGNYSVSFNQVPPMNSNQMSPMNNANSPRFIQAVNPIGNFYKPNLELNGSFQNFSKQKSPTGPILRNFNHQLSDNSFRSPVNALKKGFDESMKRQEISACVTINQHKQGGKRIRNLEQARNHVPQFIQRENAPFIGHHMHNNFDPGARSSRLDNSNGNRQLFISPEARMQVPVQQNYHNGVRHKRLQAVNYPLPYFFSPLARN